MPGKAFVISTLVLATVAGTGYLLSAENRFEFRWLREFSHGPSGAQLHDAAARETVAPPQPQPEPEPEPPSDNALGFMLASVAEQYQKTIRYPSWSIPLTPEQAQAYRGNHYEPVSLPLPGDGQFTVMLEKYRFTRGETILVAAAIQGPQVVGGRLQATLEAPVSRDAVASTTLEQTASPGYYEGILDTDTAPGEYRLIVEATIDGRPLRHASALTIEPYLGEFSGLGSARISNNNLVIPVRFSPEEPGFYGLTAQLYAGQHPIALLQAEKRMDSSTDTIELRAHGTVLAGRNVDGPFHLRHIQIRQLPARPGDRTNYAFGPEEGYSFSPPDLDDLTNTPVVDPESEQRAALLRQLADKF